MDAKLQQQSPQKAQTNKPNLTGIPTQMKLDFERRSGLSFDDVRVHYNSDKPAQLQALAYTQGTQVYVGPGQERHLPHELGHVIQQKSRVVPPTLTVHGCRINTDTELEKEANLFAQSKENCSFLRYHSDLGNANTIQAQFEITYFGGRIWSVDYVGRPNFSKDIDEIGTKYTLVGSRNHFIPSKGISDTIQQIVIDGLTGREGILPHKYPDESGENAESIRKALIALCNLVAPNDNLKMGENNPFFNPLIWEKTHNDAIQIIERITNTFLEDPVDQYTLGSYIDKLEFLLHNSYANLRIGNFKVNSAIKNYLDFPLIVQYPLAPGTKTIKPYWENGEMVIDLTNPECIPLVKRFNQIYKLQNFFPHISAIPKIAEDGENRLLVSSDLVKDYEEYLDSLGRRSPQYMLPKHVVFKVLYKKRSAGTETKRSLIFTADEIEKHKLTRGKGGLRIREEWEPSNLFSKEERYFSE